jgi:hypothetical protein
MILCRSIFLLLLAGRVAFADDWRPLECNPGATLGAWSCAATSCHGGSERSRRTSGGELERWRNADPHARAGNTIEGAKFADILLRVGIISKVGDAKGPGQRFDDLAKDKDDPSVRTTAISKLNECLNCHNPQGVPTSWTRETVQPQQEDGDMIADGFAIGCETCHGPAKRWLGNHFRRDFDRGQSGFHDLKNLLLRARTCAQCHIGDEKHDMNHDMIAAGHPPLRFDLASYQRELPKHWNDNRQRSDTNQYELKLWLAGQIANFDAGLSLLESRLTRATEAPTSDRTVSPSPEFAESNCASCHHRLRAEPEWDDAGIVARPLEPALSNKNWNCGALQALLGLDRPADAAKLPAIRADFRKFASAKYAPLLQPQASLPSELLREVELQSNYDQQLQAYAFYLATAKSRYDEQVKSLGDAPRPAALVELESLRAMLQPRLPGDSAPAERPKYDQVLKLFQAAGRKLD